MTIKKTWHKILTCVFRLRRYMEDALTVEVKEMIEKEFGPNDITVHMNRIKDCLNRCDFLSVFEMDIAGVKEIDVAMLQALLKGKVFIVLAT